MKKLLFPLFIVIACSCYGQSKSQNGYSYRTALGIKVWYGAGITLKHFFQPNKAGEIIGYFHSHGFRFTALYEIHGPINGAPGLKWYIGPGVHIGLYDHHHHKHEDDEHHDTHAHAGIDGVIGLDYKFKGAPINLSLDWQPAFEFGHDLGFSGSWGGLGIRYTF